MRLPYGNRILYLYSLLNHPAIEKGHDLCAGDRSFGAEMYGICTLGDVVLCRPQNCIVVIIACLYIHEEVEHRVVFHERGTGTHLAAGHLKAVLAVAEILDFNLLAVLVRNGEGLKCESLVRRDSERHSGACGGILRADLDLAVPDVCRKLDRIAARTATAAVRGNRAFPPESLKHLYARRWGIETSFRQLKYTLGLVYFRAKKVEFIFQEVFAKLTMYNFSELTTSSAVIRKCSTKFAYSVNFSAAVHICRNFFSGNASPPQLEALLSRLLVPIRSERSNTRKPAQRPPFSFLYRVA